MTGSRDVFASAGDGIARGGGQGRRSDDDQKNDVAHSGLHGGVSPVINAQAAARFRLMPDGAAPKGAVWPAGVGKLSRAVRPPHALGTNSTWPRSCRAKAPI